MATCAQGCACRCTSSRGATGVRSRSKIEDAVVCLVMDYAGYLCAKGLTSAALVRLIEGGRKDTLTLRARWRRDDGACARVCCRRRWSWRPGTL